MGRSLRRPRCHRYLLDGAASLILVTSSLLLSIGPASAETAALGTVSPQTASGCNQNVCIYVEGSGTQVTYWSTTAALPASMCTLAKYWANGALVYEGNTKCGSSGAQAFSYWSDPGYFAVGTQLCSTWTGIPGKPCETIE
jgi:hypothetical protein